MQAKIIHDDFLKIQKILKSKGSDPKVYMTENECYSDLKEAMENYKLDFQLDQPHVHIRNAEKRANRTCKNHLISGFSATNPYLPISKWDQLIYQCMITLNLLRNSTVNSALSA